METLPIDTSKKAPSVNAYSINFSKFWTPTVTNNLILGMVQRNGIAKKIVKKLKTEMTKFLFTLEDESVDNARYEYEMDKIAAYAWECAFVSGYSLIYIGSTDVKSIEDYKKEPPTFSATNVDYFYVIPKAWVCQDYKVEGSATDYDYYKIYTDGGNTIDIHKDRFIRVRLNEEERSSFESAYNSLDVVDNILWSVGQAMFRAGQGFPVLTVTQPQSVPDGNGGTKNELELLRDQGVLRDINAMTGFMGDERYKLEFIGTNGKALNPSEYWNVAMEAVAASIDLPKDIIIGLSAGAISGSEINTKELASNVIVRQQMELEPIYDDMFTVLGFNSFDIEYNWIPTYVESQKEQAETLEIEMRALNSGVISGVFDAKFVQNVLMSRHEWLRLVAEEQGGLAEPVEQETEVETKAQPNETAVGDSLVSTIAEGTTLPPKIQQTEIQLMRDMVKQYSKTQKNVEALFTAFNTDEDN